MKLALEALDTVGTVDVERYDGDEEVRESIRGSFVSCYCCRAGRRRLPYDSLGTKVTRDWRYRTRSKASSLNYTSPFNLPRSCGFRRAIIIAGVQLEQQ